MLSSSSLRRPEETHFTLEERKMELEGDRNGSHLCINQVFLEEGLCEMEELFSISFPLSTVTVWPVWK